METSFVRVCDYDMSSRVHRVLPLHLDFERLDRLGPNELTIFTPEILPCIFQGQNNPFDRPAWHGNVQSYIGLTDSESARSTSLDKEAAGD